MVTAAARLGKRSGWFDAGLSWEEKRHLVELLVKGIRIETCIHDEEAACSVVQVTHRFEPHSGEVLIPIEPGPLLADAETPTNWSNLLVGI